MENVFIRKKTKTNGGFLFCLLNCFVFFNAEFSHFLIPYFMHGKYFFPKICANKVKKKQLDKKTKTLLICFCLFFLSRKHLCILDNNGKPSLGLNFSHKRKILSLRTKIQIYILNLHFVFLNFILSSGIFLKGMQRYVLENPETERNLRNFLLFFVFVWEGWGGGGLGG